MSDILGVRHRALNSLNMIGPRGSEGQVQIKTDTFTYSGAAAADVLCSDILKIVKDSVVLNVMVGHNGSLGGNAQVRPRFINDQGVTEVGASLTLPSSGTAGVQGILPQIPSAFYMRPLTRDTYYDLVLGTNPAPAGQAWIAVYYLNQ